MKKKFTAGDWFVTGITEVQSMPSQCKITNFVSGGNYEESVANAKLIAAAPDMFAALESIVNNKEVWDQLDADQRKNIQYALKKATTERF